MTRSLADEIQMFGNQTKKSQLRTEENENEEEDPPSSSSLPPPPPPSPSRSSNHSNTYILFILFILIHFITIADRGIIPGASIEFTSFFLSSTTSETPSSIKLNPDIGLGLLQAAFVIGFSMSLYHLFIGFTL